jgi:hypothetical protein
MQLDALAHRKPPGDGHVDREGQLRIDLGDDAGPLEAALEDELAHGAGAEADMALGRGAEADALGRMVAHMPSVDPCAMARCGAALAVTRPGTIVLSPMKLVKRVRGRR